MYWVVKNKKNIRRFQQEEVRTLWFYSLVSIPKFLKANIWVNDRGKGDIPVRKSKNSYWIQLWHGIPFKGFAGNKEIKKAFNEFDLHPVSSEWLKSYYINGIGVKKNVVVTGYPRIDRLLKPYYYKDRIIKEMGLNSNQPIVLYAPTWSHDSKVEKDLFPWGNERALKMLIAFMEENKLQMIIRLHPNWNCWTPEMVEVIKNSKHIIVNSVKTDWDSEKYIYISDILVTDYSSIANDFIVLNRPMIFLETHIKIFEYGFALKPEERAGIVVKSEDEFFKAILESHKNPKKYEEKRKRIEKKIHFKMDGKASKRVVKAMEKYISQE